MSKTKLRVRDVEKEIPTVSPSLMPFRIAYSGPAPISTYFLTRPFVDANEKRRLAVGTTLAGESERVQDAPGEKKDALSGQPVIVTTKDQPEAGTNTQLLAAFRGRKVVSYDMVLPDGYTGLLLTSASAVIAEDASREDENVGRMAKRGNAKARSAVVKAGDRAKALKAKAAAKKAGAKGGARRSRKVIEEDVEEDELEPEDQPVQLEDDAAENGGGVPADPLMEDNVFEVTGQFQRFSLWHPDVPVDEARDEYTRSLKEWISLASEIHRI